VRRLRSRSNRTKAARRTMAPASYAPACTATHPSCTGGLDNQNYYWSVRVRFPGANYAERTPFADLQSDRMPCSRFHCRQLQ
jgi:hypothetical protein